MPPKRQYDLEERLLEFSASIIRLSDEIRSTPGGTHVAQQVLRSGTASLANHGEAQAAESRRDFVHKMVICLKELRETCRWLKLIRRTPLVTDLTKVDPLVRETDELVRIFATSVRTARANLEKPFPGETHRSPPRLLADQQEPR